MAKLVPSPFGVEVKRLRLERKLSQDDLAARSGLQQGAVSHLEVGRRKDAEPDTVRKLAKGLGVAVEHFAPFLPDGFLSRFSLPLLGRVPAGAKVVAWENTGERFDFADRFGGSDHYMLQVRGESMRDAGILDGSYVVVRRVPDAESGDKVVVAVDGELTLKRLIIKRPKGKPIEYWLSPCNDTMMPTKVVPGSEVQILGKAIGVVLELK
jgi:SOS-response transcriptional repressor LexA